MDTTYQDQSRRMLKRQSKVHFSVPDVEASTLHHLVPLCSERRVQQSPNTPLTPETGRPSKSGIYEPHFAFPAASISTTDSGFESISEDIDTSADASEETGSSIDEEEFPSSSTMMNLEASSYSESISVGIVPKQAKSRCISVSNYNCQPRNRECVRFSPGLNPVKYQNRMIVYNDSSRKKYKSIVHYVPKMKPSGYSSTCFIRPTWTVESFVSLLDYSSHSDRKWYQCTLEMRPKTYSSSKLPCFEMNNNVLDSDGEEDSYDDRNNVDLNDREMTDLGSPYVVNAKVWDYTNASTAPRSFRESFHSSDDPLKQETFSTKFVVANCDENHDDEDDVFNSEIHDLEQIVKTAPKQWLNSVEKVSNSNDNLTMNNNNNQGYANEYEHIYENYPPILTTGNDAQNLNTTIEEDIIDGDEQSSGTHEDILNHNAKNPGITVDITDREESDDSECYVNDDSMAKCDGDLFKGYSSYLDINGYGGSAGSLNAIDL